MFLSQQLYWTEHVHFHSNS